MNSRWLVSRLLVQVQYYISKYMYLVGRGVLVGRFGTETSGDCQEGDTMIRLGVRDASA